MRTLEIWLLAYALNSLWQVPLMFCVAWIVARLMRRLGPAMEHRVWLTALLLEVILPACVLRLAGLWSQLRHFILGASADPGGHVRVTIGAANTHGIATLIPPRVLSVVLIAYACSVLYFCLRLAWGVWQTYRMTRQAATATIPHEVVAAWARYETGAKITISTRVSGPVTVGIWRRALLLPTEFLESVNEGDLNAVLAHESSHIRRRDFAKNLVYELLSLPVNYHPLLWATRSRLAETREMICDTQAAAAVAGRDKYARSLLRLASMLSDRGPARTLHAIGIFDANIFERRIMNLTQKKVEVRGASRWITVAACGAIALATCTSAVALRMDLTAPQAEQTESHGKLKVDAKKLVILSKPNPVYPAQAKADKDILNGPVVLSVIIGKDGSAEQIRVKQSLRKDYDSSALDAVREWKWQPYLLNGQPTEIETTVTVTFSITP